MSTQPASQEELVSFLDKLAQFRDSLEPADQAILDEMTASALSADQQEVQGFANIGTISGAFGNQQLLARPYYRPYYNAVGNLTTLPGG
jgi:hypothetical protein